MIRRIIRGTAVVGAVLAITFTAATAPASAESDRDGDRGDVTGRADILSVKATHTQRLVIVVVRARDIRRGGTYAIGINFDTKRYRSLPPEYGVAFVPDGTLDFGRWSRGEVPQHVNVPCRGDYKNIDYRLDRATYVVPRRCLGTPRQVRVQALTIRHPKGEDARVIDSAPGRYKYLEWLSRG